MSAKCRCDGWVQYEWRSPEAFFQHPSGVSGCYWHLVSHWLGKICSGDCPECDQSISYSHQPFITRPSGKLKCGSHSNCHPLPPHSLGGLEMFVSEDVLSPSTAGWDLCWCWVLVLLQPGCLRVNSEFSKGYGGMILSFTAVDFKEGGLLLFFPLLVLFFYINRKEVSKFCIFYYWANEGKRGEMTYPPAKQGKQRPCITKPGELSIAVY